MIAVKAKLTSLVCLLLVCALCCGLCGCGSPSDEEPLKAENLAVIHEPEFGGVYLKMTIDDFNALGFQYGDSVTVRFSNGYTLENLPYYNGYYVDAGEPLLVAYPGYDYIKAAVNYGDDLWETAQLEETDTATVTLQTRGAYLDMQNARDIHYFDEREKYDSDEIFANFRVVSVGKLKDGILCRAASPCDNQHNRAPYVDALIEQAGVRCILNLADNEEKIGGYLAADGFNSPYFLSLYKDGRVIPLAMSMNYGADDFKAKIASGFTAMADMEGPYLVHCTEGKDRTGFMCMLLEALAGATYDEIVADYMKTYDNYYGITENSDAAKYALIKEKNIDAMLQTVAGENVDIKTADLASCVTDYLQNAGMTADAVAALRDRLVNQD